MVRRSFILGFVLFLSSCATGGGGGGGISVRTLNLEQAGVLRCLGLEAHEIIALSRAAVKDIGKNFLDENPALIREGRPLRVVVDSAFWKNDARQTINLNMIADQLSIGLQRASEGKMAFLSRENLEAVEMERALKRDGKVDRGALGLVDKIAGADYRMIGRITDHSAGKQRGTTISLWLIDLETGARVWAWQFNVIKEGDDESFC